MNGRTRKLEPLIEKIYASALLPELWPETLRGIGQFTRSRDCLFQGYELDNGVARPLFSWAGVLDQSAFARHAEIVAISGDIRAANGVRAPSGQVVQDLDYISEAEMKRHPYWQELLMPLELKYAAMVSCGTTQDGRNAEAIGFSLQRTPRQGPLVGDDSIAFEALVPHLLRSGRILRRFGKLRSSSFVSTHSSPAPAIFRLDARGNVLSMNDVGEDYFAASVLAITRGGALTVHSRVADRSIHRAIHLTLARDARAPVSGTLKTSAGAWNYWIAPISDTVHEHEADYSSRVALELHLTLRDEGSRAVLTVAEERIASSLCAGRSLRQAASDSGVAYETARNQLKSAMNKLGVSSQSALVSTLLLRRYGVRSEG